MSIYGVHKLCRAALQDRAMRKLMADDPARALQQFPLSDEERQLLLAGEVGKLWEMGTSGFLLSYLTRWELFGLTVPVYSQRMRAAKDWRAPQGSHGVTSGRTPV
jgi:hypothetical protein